MADKLYLSLSCFAVGVTVIALVRKRSIQRKPLKHIANVLLSMPNVFCRDPWEVAKRIMKIVHEGEKSVSVLTDFDMTMTRFMVNGKRGSSTHNAMERCSLMPDWMIDTSKSIFDKYYPLEISTTISHEEKVQAMEAWWREAHELAVKSGFKRSYLPKAVDEANLVLRDGTIELIDKVLDNHIPLGEHML